MGRTSRKTNVAKPGVVWEGDFLATHSLATVNREIALALLRRKTVDLGLVLRDDNPEEPAGRLAPLARAIGSRPEQVSVHVRHFWPPVFDRPSDGKFVLMQPWEFGSLPGEWVEQIARGVDEVWAYTEFVKREYVESGVPEDKVKVVPLGVNPKLFNPAATPMKLDSTKPFRFLFVGGTIPRKGIDILINAYCSEFTSSDDVCLVIKDFGAGSFYKGQSLRDKILGIGRQKGMPEVIFLDDDIPDQKMPGLYTACDCLVQPYRGEGFGLPVAEGMACGLPAIVTEYGACLDYCNHENAYLIPARVERLAEKRVGDVETVDFPYWAEPDATALRKLMRRAYENQDEIRAKGAESSKHILSHFTWDEAASAVEQRLAELSRSTIASKSPARHADEQKQLGLQALREARYDDVVRLLTAALDEAPEDVGAMNALACAYEALGNRKSALSTLGRAQDVNPDYAATHQNFAVILARADRPLEAADHICHALQLDPGNAEALSIMEETRTLVRAMKPANPGKAKKHRNQHGPTRADIDSRLAAMNSALRRSSGPGTSLSAPKLSLCMIARDEETFLHDCLSSVEDVADEIVVLDTGSTDRTVEIASAHGAAVKTYQWSESYSDARNAALQYVTGDWVLVLDADERLDEESKPAILEAIRRGEADAFELSIRNYRSDGPTPDVVVSRACRLYRNSPQYRYQGRVHERIVPAIAASGGKVGRLDAVIHHHGYRPEILEQRSKHERYIELLRAELADCPGDLHCLYNLGLAYSSKGDFESALESLRQAADSVTADHELAPSVFSAVANAYCMTGKPEQALESVERAERVGIRHPELSFGKGNALLMLGRCEDAITEFESAVRNGRAGDWTGDTSTCGYKADFGIASAYMALGDMARAVEYGEKTAIAKPDDAGTHELLALAYAHLGRPDRSEKHLLQLLRLRPDDAKAGMNLADLYQSQGRNLEARARYSALLASGRDSVELRLRLGTCALAGGDRVAAEEHLRQAVALRPDCTQAYVDLGRVHALQGRMADALDCFARVVDIDPTCANAYFNAADLLYSAGRYKEAADVYQSGLSYSARNAPAFLALGNCYYHMGIQEAAAIAYRQALAIRPDYREAENNLSMLEEASDELKAA